MPNQVHFKVGLRVNYEDLEGSEPDQNTLYFVNSNGQFDPHGMGDDGDLYLGGFLIGVSRAEKTQIDSSISQIEQILSQLQTVDSSSWYIGDDSSAMNGWQKTTRPSSKDYCYDVSLGDFIYSEKLEISVSLTLENWSNIGYLAQIYAEIGFYEHAEGDDRLSWRIAYLTGNPFSTQTVMSYVASKDTQYWSNNVHFSGIIYGPFYTSENNYMLRLHIIVPNERYIVARSTTADSMNASQLIIRGYRSLL